MRHPWRSITLAGLLVLLFTLVLSAPADSTAGQTSVADTRLRPGLASNIASITETFTGVDRAEISSEYPDTPDSPYRVSMWVSRDDLNGKTQACLVRFDLSSLPPNAVIDSASLELYRPDEVARWNMLEVVSIGAYYVTSPWSRWTVTWNTAPSVATVGISAPVDNSVGWKSWAVTYWAQTWYSNPGQNYGVLLHGPLSGSGYFRPFATGVWSSNLRPRLVVTYHLGSLCDSVTEIPKAECQALVDLYNGTGGPAWTTKTNWLATNTPCSWYGVACSGGHVTDLNLYTNNLNGAMPGSLGNLASLLYLRLWENHLSGSIPSSLATVSNLQYLALYQNQLTGSIPAGLGSLSSLQWLELDHNQLIGDIPSSLGNLSNLKSLSLQSNGLSGKIPSGLGNLSALRQLSLNDNTYLGGDLPASLTNLYLIEFHFHNTKLCEPPDTAFQAWLAGILDLQGTGVICPESQPKIISVSPSCGRSNASQKVEFTTIFEDPNGANDFKLVYFIVNQGVSYVNGVGLAYNLELNKMVMRNDANTGWIVGGAPGAGTDLATARATLHVSQSTASKVGNRLTVKWAVTFKQPFSGKAYNLHMVVVDMAHHHSSWQTVGSWGIGTAGSPPCVGPITPVSGGSPAGQLVYLNTQFSDPDGLSDFKTAYVLISAVPNISGQAVYLAYNHNVGKILLRNDSNTAWLGGFAPGSVQTIQNGRVIVHVANCSVSTSGSVLTVHWALEFKPAFAGQKNVYASALDNHNYYAAWQKKGAWDIY